jgi:natural product biosynthesis luciferase-like monooxygenase protein
MHFSLMYIPCYLPDQNGSINAYYENMLTQIAFADREGWEVAWVSEHHAHPYGGIVPSNALFGVAAAQRTKRIRIGSAVSVLPLNSPLHLAEQFAMLDHLSNGRVEFGIGRGYLQHEYKAFGVPIEKSWQYFTEAHDLIVKAWQNDEFSYEGEIWSVKGGRILPRPQQRPHPPIWVAASANRDTFEFAGQNGYNLMLNLYTKTEEEIAYGLNLYRHSLQRHGHAINIRRIAATQHLFVGSTIEEARELPREALLHYLGAVGQALSSSKQSQAVRQPGADNTLAVVHQVRYEDMYPQKVTFGTPEQVYRRIQELEHMGITDLCFMAHFGNMNWATSQSSVELFTREVMPYFGM